jgi:hypothetical protein
MSCLSDEGRAIYSAAVSTHGDSNRIEVLHQQLADLRGTGPRNRDQRLHLKRQIELLNAANLEQQDKAASRGSLGEPVLAPCGHMCELRQPKCCIDGDSRPVPPNGLGYEAYIDGVGFTNTALRHSYYCPSCKMRAEGPSCKMRAEEGGEVRARANRRTFKAVLTVAHVVSHWKRISRWRLAIASIITVKICTMAGADFELPMPKTATVAHLRVAISRHLEVLTSSFQLFVAGSEQPLVGKQQVLSIIGPPSSSVPVYMLQVEHRPLVCAKVEQAAALVEMLSEGQAPDHNCGVWRRSRAGRATAKLRQAEEAEDRRLTRNARSAGQVYLCCLRDLKQQRARKAAAIKQRSGAWDGGLKWALAAARGARERLLALPWSHRHQFRFPHDTHCRADLQAHFAGDVSGEIHGLLADAAAEGVKADARGDGDGDGDSGAAALLAKIAQQSALGPLPEHAQGLCAAKAAAGVQICQHEADFDTNGILYWLATKGGTCTYTNPTAVYTYSADTTQQPVAVTAQASSEFRFAAHRLAQHRHDGVINGTKSAKSSSVAVVLGGGAQAELNHYCLRHGNSSGSYRLRHWVLEASQDGRTWTTLRSHHDDASLPDAGFSTAGWVVEGGKGAFSHFRVRQTGKNSSGFSTTGGLMCAGIELYGSLLPPLVPHPKFVVPA